jgi:hypothetical protein
MQTPPIEPIATPDMDTETLRRLAVLETKLDYLIEHSKASSDNIQELSKRVDQLEGHRQWVVGGAAVALFTSSILLFALRGHVNDLIDADQASRSYLDEVCAEVRLKRPTAADYPTICNL